MWNDVRIVEDNPSTFESLILLTDSLDVLLPAVNIKRVLRGGEGGYSYQILENLATFVDDWEYEPSPSLPSNLTVIMYFMAV